MKSRHQSLRLSPWHVSRERSRVQPVCFLEHRVPSVDDTLLQYLPFQECDDAGEVSSSSLRILSLAIEPGVLRGNFMLVFSYVRGIELSIVPYLIMI